MPDLVRIRQVLERPLEQLLSLRPGQQSLSIQGVGPGPDGVLGGVIALNLVGCQHAVDLHCSEVGHPVHILLLSILVGVLGVCSLVPSPWHGTLIIYNIYTDQFSTAFWLY